MKTNLLRFACVFLCLYLVGCGGDDKSIISQKWRLAEVTSPKIVETQKNLKDKELENFKEAQAQILEKTSFTFQENGKYEIIFFIAGKDRKSTGTWEVVTDEEGKFLETKEDSTNREQRLRIETLSNSEFVLRELKSDSTILKLVPANQ